MFRLLSMLVLSLPVVLLLPDSATPCGQHHRHSYCYRPAYVTCYPETVYSSQPLVYDCPPVWSYSPVPQPCVESPAYLRAEPQELHDLQPTPQKAAKPMIEDSPLDVPPALDADETVIEPQVPPQPDLPPAADVAQPDEQPDDALPAAEMPEETPGAESVDDLFPASADDAPADLPFEDPDAVPSEEMPADAPVEEPVDSLFDAAPEEAAPELPSEEAPDAASDATPADPPAEESIDSLFDADPDEAAPEMPADEAIDAASEPVPADAPAEESVDLLFGAGPEDAAPELPADEGSAAASEEPPADAAAEESLDSLFDAGTEDAVPESRPEEAPADPAEEMPEPVPADESLDSLFDSGSEELAPASSDEGAQRGIDRPATGVSQRANRPVAARSPRTLTSLPGGFRSNEWRTWRDNTGDFSCQARLVQLLDGKVRLLKVNGRTTTVPFHRLSLADRRFVQAQADSVRQVVLMP